MSGITDNIIAILAVLSAAVALLKSFGAWPFEKRKADADASKTYAEAAKISANHVADTEAKILEKNEIIERLEKRQDELEERLDTVADALKIAEDKQRTLEIDLCRAENYITQMLAGIRLLTEQVIDCGEKPVWMPEDYKRRSTP